MTATSFRKWSITTIREIIKQITNNETEFELKLIKKIKTQILRIQMKKFKNQIKLVENKKME